MIYLIVSFKTSACSIEAHVPCFRAETKDEIQDEEEELGHTAPICTSWGDRGIKKSGFGIMTPNKQRLAINNLCPYKSSSPDDIYSVLLQRAGKTVIGVLTRIESMSRSLVLILTD